MTIPDDVKMTPWLEQYREFKARYPDALLLFRMGDFYELFFDDARTAASVLDIALTARDADRKIPMAGVPHHALNIYLGRLIKAGYRAAICEQTGETPSKGIVERRVVRVVTPGTYVPEESGDSAAHLAAILPLRGRVAMAFLSVDTGLLEAGTLDERDAAAMFLAFSPGEALYPSNAKEESLPAFVRGRALRPAAPELFRAGTAAKRLSSALNVPRLAGFGIDEEDPCVGPAWAVLDYLSATQFSSVRHVLRITPLAAKGRMTLDAAAQRNLELTPEAAAGGPSLLSCVDDCRTPMGRRTLRDWLLRPLMDVEAIRRRQSSIGAIAASPVLLSRLQDVLSGARDMERATARLSIGAGTPRDLAAIRDTLRLIPDMTSLSLPEPLSGLLKSMPDTSALREYLDDALEEELPRALAAGPVIRSSFSTELASWRDAAGRGEEWLEQYLEKERAACGSPKLRAGYNRAFGYYLETGRAGLANIPPHFERRQTLVNAQRYVTPELRAFQDRMERGAAEAARIEEELYRGVVDRVLDEAGAVQTTGRLLGILDCAASGASIARKRGYVCPRVDESASISIRGGRHPVIEAAMEDSQFVPNDVTLGGEGKARVIILTGPNMAGKSTWLRMTALIAIMAQAGLWVPAEEASIGLVDRVFTRIGARDDLAGGNSTFMVEMLETANILNNVTDRSLVILDEVGRGTATWDGMSIAWAVLEYLHSVSGARVLFATHYHELTCLEAMLDGVKNYSMAVSGGKDGIRFLHQVEEGPANRSYGIEVARLAGMPQSVLRRASELLKSFEEGGGPKAPAPAAPAGKDEPDRQLRLF